jgi:histidinol-phosphate aminotransferase
MNKNFDINNLVRKNIKNLKPYSSARDEFRELGQDMIFLDANENPFYNGLNRYPDPYQYNLKMLFSKQKKVKVENILLGNGSDEVLDLIFRAFCEPREDHIITMPPTYGMYKVLAQTNNVLCKEVLLKTDFQIDIDNVFSEINKNTKLIFICSPNNPTGNVMEKNDVQRILQNFKGLLVIDEAYIDFTNTKSWVDEIKNYSNLIVTQTLSKAYGLAGIRLGICYANAEIISVLNKIKAPYNVNEITQKKAIDALKNIKEVDDQVYQIKLVRKGLLNNLKEINFIKKIYPTNANFVLIKVDDANKRYRQLIEKGIVVRNRTNVPLCKNCLRITCGAEEEIVKLIHTLKLLDS